VQDTLGKKMLRSYYNHFRVGKLQEPLISGLGIFNPNLILQYPSHEIKIYLEFQKFTAITLLNMRKQSKNQLLFLKQSTE